MVDGLGMVSGTRGTCTTGEEDGFDICQHQVWQSELRYCCAKTVQQND